MTVLFICSGNIHRSAVAEAILRAAARRDGRTDLTARSAGVLAVDGMEAAAEAVAVAREAGLDLSAHRARRVTDRLLDDAASIVLAERFHREWLEVHHAGALERCRMMSDYAAGVARSAGVAPGEDVPDAMGGDLDSFRRSFAIIDECVRRLYRELPPAPHEVYARAIEERFRSHRHTPLTLPPADFVLIESWWSRGVPLFIVLESLDDLFRRKDRAGGPERVRRLSFAKEEVEERFEAYERARAGTAPSAAPTAGDGAALLRDAAGLLRAAAGDAARRGLTEASALFGGMAERAAVQSPEAASDAAAARLHLHGIEQRLLEGLMRLAGEEKLAALRGQATERLEQHRGRMTAGAFQSTVERLVAEEIREIYGAPDLARI